MLKIRHFSIISALVVSSALASANEGVPALSVVAPNGQSSILIGSLHVGIEGLREPDNSVFKQAKRFVIEHHSVPQPGDAGSAPGQERAAWAKNLTEHEIAIYLERARCANIAEPDALAYLSRPSVQWANQYAYTVCGGSFVPSRDLVLTWAMPREVPTVTLEDDSWAEAKRRTVPAQVGDAGFKWALSHDPKTVLNDMRDAFNNGDYDAVREQYIASVGNADVAEIMVRIMVDERNAAWMPKLLEYLNDGQAVILVGAMHLPGPNGLISLLKSRGYTVSATTLPQRR